MEYHEVERLFNFTWTHGLSFSYGDEGLDGIIFDTDYGDVHLPSTVLAHCDFEELADLYVRQSGRIALDEIWRNGITYERYEGHGPMYSPQLEKLWKLDGGRFKMLVR